MAKCQKSENFLSELQQAFSQAKRSVQEQMVRECKAGAHLSSTTCLTSGLGVFAEGFVVLPSQGWLERAVWRSVWRRWWVGSGSKCWTCSTLQGLSYFLCVWWTWTSPSTSLPLHSLCTFRAHLVSYFTLDLKTELISSGQFFSDSSQVPPLVNVFLRDEYSISPNTQEEIHMGA